MFDSKFSLPDFRLSSESVGTLESRIRRSLCRARLLAGYIGKPSRILSLNLRELSQLVGNGALKTRVTIRISSKIGDSFLDLNTSMIIFASSMHLLKLKRYYNIAEDRSEGQDHCEHSYTAGPTRHRPFVDVVLGLAGLAATLLACDRAS
jgi:hypothetical protein